MNRAIPWIPAGIMVVGAVFTTGGGFQRTMPLRLPLDSVVPYTVDGRWGQDIIVSPEEVAVAGMSSYVLRNYEPTDTASTALPFSIYVGYYERQTRGRTIHSPKNCLPGSGWQALASRYETIPTPAGDVRVNRYVLQRDRQQAVVLYWYQGRGRTEANEYVVKWDLLRDAAVLRRTEEALVRVVVPVRGDVEEAFQLASRAVVWLVPAVRAALPATGD